MRDKGGNPAEWTDEVCSELLGQTAAEASGSVVADLSAYLDSWRGPEEEKWAGCYVALRASIRRRVE
jgi:hypothetical protein